MKTTERRGGRRGNTALAIAAVSGASFLALLGGLSRQLASGHDPALATTTATRPAEPPRRILLRRIHKRVIVTRVIPAAPAGGSAVAPSAPVGGSAPVVSSAPVVTSAPAPTPVPAPAPAPAPAPVTRSS